MGIEASPRHMRVAASHRGAAAYRSRSSRAFGVLALASAMVSAGCAEASPLDGSVADWLRGGSGEHRASLATGSVGSPGGAAPGTDSAPVDIPPNVSPPSDAETSPDAEASSDAGSSSDAGLSPSCAPDEFEPNDEPDAATPISTRRFEAVLCAEADYYSFPAPAPAGTQFSVRVRFDLALGDIDAVLTTAADGVVVAESASVIGEEVVSAVSDGGRYVLEVSLFEPGAPAGSPYTVEVLVAAEADNDCCTESGAPGCSDPSLRECVCAVDPYCCVSGFDAYCVQLGVSQCASQCQGPANSGSCCSESSGSGCGDDAVEACVCGLAPYCCSGPYDNACVSLASGVCGATCKEATR